MKTYFAAIRQIFGLTLTIILSVILPLVLVTLVTSKQQVLGLQSFVVVSGSMDPALPVGSVIYTVQQPSYKIGDVISFKDGKRTITHRIADVKIDGENISYVTKGDANKTPDTIPVLKSQVLGKEVLHAFHVGKLIYFLKTIPGFLLLIILPSLLFIGAELWSIKKEFEKEIRKKIFQQIQMGQSKQVSS